jgi:hypothetical protein
MPSCIVGLSRLGRSTFCFFIRNRGNGPLVSRSGGKM